MLGPVDRERAGERRDGSLRRGIGGLLGQRDERRLGGDVDDCARSRPEQRPEGLGRLEDAEEVDLEVAAEVLGVELVDRVRWR